jgi:hypothetical protein
MIKYRTVSDNIYNLAAVAFAALAFSLLLFYQVYLLFNQNLKGFNIFYNIFSIVEIVCLCGGGFFSFKQLVRNRHIETVTAAVLLAASLFSFIAFNFCALA